MAEPKQRLRFLDQERTVPSCQRGAQVKIHGPIQQRICDVPELSYKLGTGCAVTTTMCGRACEALKKDCSQSNMHGREVGGMLVGYCYTRAKGFTKKYEIAVTDLIPVEPFDSSDAHICFGKRAWKRAEQELRARYSPEGKRRLGWYHTHPVQGIFFSLQDRAAHSVFRRAFEFALVVDPRMMDAGLFYWSDYHGKVLAGPILFSLIEPKE
jgi:proteasome lid subunit RPN8/RPN11